MFTNALKVTLENIYQMVGVWMVGMANIVDVQVRNTGSVGEDRAATLACSKGK